jgi:PAS domain S-box-containing protein
MGTGTGPGRELLRQKQRLEPLLEISPTAIVITDLAATIVAWNPAAEKLFGYAEREAVGRNLDDLVAKTEELHTDAVAYSERTSRERDRIHTITRRTRKDGTLVDVELLGSPLLVDGDAVGILGIYHDITELNRQRRFLEALIQVSPEAIVITDMDSTVTSWNPGAERLFGYTAEEAIGRNINDLVARRPDLRPEAVAADRQADSTGHIRLVTQRTRKDGSLVDIDVVGAPIAVGGQPVARYVIYHDITELQQQKRYFQSLLEISPAAIAVTDLEGKVVSWNPAAESLFGYSAEEAVGRLLDELVATRPELHDEAVGYSQAAARGEHVHATARRTRKDGSLVDVQLATAPVGLGHERQGFLAIYHDISEIQRQNLYYQALVQSSPVAVALLDPEGIVTSWNPTAERLFGYTAQEAVGRNIDDLVAASEEVRAEAEAYTRNGMRGELQHAITRRTRKDGTLIDVEMFGAPVTVAGEAAGLYAMFIDISELQGARREAEAATHAKSAFLATMSHEIRTPLNAVIGMTGLLLDTELTPQQRNFAEVVRNSGDALLTVINEILDFSKIEAGRLELERQPFDLRQCVESALELVATDAAEKGLDVAYVHAPEVPPAIVGDVTRLRQILLNLLNNAVKFTERGEVVVTADAEPVPASGEPTGSDGKRFRLAFAVRDTGIGIPEDRMDGLFESFSQVDTSTTRRYGGTGLGLAISRRLTELMNGRMWAESRVGEGSTFHFTILAEEVPAPTPAYEAGAPQLEGKRVLIVDDNATNREILRRQTASWGMLAWETESPREALEWVRRGDPFDIAILDMQMPEMDGLTLAGEIRRHRDARTLPLIMLTSLGRRAETDAEPFAAHLTKPIRPSQLYDALMGVFGGRTGERAVMPAGTPSGRPGPRSTLRILVAEDNAVNQQLTLLILQKLGYRADVAADGREALEALERQPYDVVLMDVHMPEMDGLEATRRIHQRWEAGDRPRIVAMTANALEGDREACLAAGMDDYISKPIREEALATALGRAAARGAPAATIDGSALDRLRETVGGEEALGELTQTFIRDTTRLLSDLRRDLEAGRTSDVRRHAHTLKSTAASFGASELSELCRRLEDLARGGSLDGGALLLAEIEAAFARARTELAPGPA